MDNDPKGTATKRVGFIDRVPSWYFLAGLAGLILVMWLLTLVDHQLFYDEFIGKYIWEPIVEDEGYNRVNTVVLMIILGFLLLWAYRLTHELKESVDLELTVGVVPYLVWGSVFRVLEDSDLFAPFAEDLQAVGRQAGNACAPEVGGSFLHNCFGVFFITPIIYVMVTFIAVLFLLLGHQAKKVAERTDVAKGLQYFGLTLAGLFALYLALWASDQTFIRFVANPLVALVACLVAFWIVWRDTMRSGRINPHWCLFAYSTIFLIVGFYYVFVWMTGGHGTWKPTGEVQWWILFAVAFAPFMLAYSSAKKGRILSGGFLTERSYGRRLETPGRPVALLITLVILEGLAIFATLLGAHHVEEHLDKGTLWSAAAIFPVLGLLAAGPLVIFVLTWVAARVAHTGFGVHPAMIFFAHPVNLIMIFGQASDGLMTSLGIDVFHYQEKHVLPRFLIEWVDGLGLPSPAGDYPTTLVMVPLKLLIVLAVIWLIDVSLQEEGPERRNLIGLVKLAIIMVGLSPGIRDAVRLAMAT